MDREGGRDDCALTNHEEVNARATATQAAALDVRRTIGPPLELNGDGRVLR
jgi:hypothetical protein